MKKIFLGPNPLLIRVWPAAPYFDISKQATRPKWAGLNWLRILSERQKSPYLNSVFFGIGLKNPKKFGLIF
jgi:hypothetical protein